jgi:hypothetical protein
LPKLSFFVPCTLTEVKNLLGFALVACAHVAVAGHGSMSSPTLLIVATCVAIVIKMATFMPALVIVCAQLCLIVQVGMALFVQVLGVLAMNATGLEVLVFALGGTLPVVAFIVTATAFIAELALLASDMLTTIVAAVTWIVKSVAPTLVGEKALLTCISFLHLMA